jgi:hypothetical protein
MIAPTPYRGTRVGQALSPANPALAILASQLLNLDEALKK